MDEHLKLAIDMARYSGLCLDEQLLAVDLLSLQYSLFVQKYGSFRRAAEILDVRPSVVSRRVQALEDALGVSLFQRQSQGARATLAGGRVLTIAQSILEQSRELLRVAGRAGTAREGTLCIGVTASIAGGGARQLLKTLLATAPNLQLIMVEGSTRDHITAVRMLRMDATFVIGTPHAQNCEIEPLWSEQIMVALATDHRLAAETSLTMDVLAAEHFIVSKADPGPDILKYVVQRFAELGYHPTVETQAVHREGLIALVGLGQGISLVSAAEIEVAYPDVVFIPLEGESSPFSLIWSAARDNPVLRRFVSLARSQAARVPH